MEFFVVAEKLLTSLPTEFVKDEIIIITIIIYYILRYLKLNLFLAVILFTSLGPSSHENTNCIHCKYVYFTFSAFKDNFYLR
jgi:hypothetical protein